MKQYIVVALIFVPTLLFAWGKEGHRMVAEIAKQKLSKPAEEKVQKYLGDMSFDDAATWMDDIKKDKANDYMKPWHYINIDEHHKYKKDTTANIVNELEKVIAELKNYKTMNDTDVNRDLKILFHLCGDMAQPLHAGFGLDKGGNDYQISYKTKGSNLHRMWDSEIIISEQITLESCMAVSKTLSKKQLKSFTKMDVLYWLNDSRKLLDVVYDLDNKTVPDQYINQNKLVIETQLLKGGYRLDAILNDIFKE